MFSHTSILGGSGGATGTVLTVIARIGSYRILVGLGDVYVSPDPETRYDMA